MINDDKLRLLSRPFAPIDIEWRIQQAGFSQRGPWARVLAYVTNRAIMNRLDEIVGPSYWKNEYTQLSDHSMLCGISIKVINDIEDEWITKWDGADNTQIEATKGGLSNAMKRAAVQWGIGRYLYQLDENWAKFSEHGHFTWYCKEKRQSFKWDAPALPDWALPKGGLK